MQLVYFEWHEFLWGNKKRFKICNKLVKTPEKFLKLFIRLPKLHLFFQ